MADQEVIKHTKKIYKIWNSKEHGFWHKAKEFVLEILIIVFAVSLSIWLHGRSEHAHQQEDVKEFMLGLKSDLQNDQNEMKEDRQMYIKSKAAFDYLVGLKPSQKPDKDSLQKYRNYFFNQTGLLANNGRFEGFKSSGKIGTIENSVLQNDIMDLYQENIPKLIIFTNYHSATKGKFTDYYNHNLKRLSDSTDNLQDILVTDEARNLERDLTTTGSIVRQYDRCINNISRIIRQIDDTYQE